MRMSNIPIKESAVAKYDDDVKKLEVTVAYDGNYISKSFDVDEIERDDVIDEVSAMIDFLGVEDDV